MRIGIDYRPALIADEGIARYVRELVRAMIEMGFDSNLGLFGYTLKGALHSRESLGLAGTRAELLRMRFPSKLVPWLLKRTGKGVDDLVGGCEVYHHTQPSRLPTRRATEVATIHDVMYVHTESGYFDPEGAEELVRRAKDLVAHSKRILVPTEFVGAEVVMALGAHPAQVTVTPLGCDHVVRHLPPGGFGKPTHPFVITVSRVDARKNHLRILRAFEALAREGYPHRWVVVGRPGYGSEAFQTALAQSPVRDRVDWRRDSADAEVIQLIAQADAMLFPSLNEGFGLPILEAMACGTPVVTSCVTSMPEVAADAAFLVEPTESDAIFEATRRLLAEPDLAEDFSLAGLRRAREFTWKECAKGTLLAYRAAMEDHEEPQLRRSL